MFCIKVRGFILIVDYFTGMDKEKTREAVNVLYEVSQLLDTGLDKYTLSLCVSLIESGVHPETLSVSID